MVLRHDGERANRPREGAPPHPTRAADKNTVFTATRHIVSAHRQSDVGCLDFVLATRPYALPGGKPCTAYTSKYTPLHNIYIPAAANSSAGHHHHPPSPVPTTKPPPPPRPRPCPRSPDRRRYCRTESPPTAATATP